MVNQKANDPLHGVTLENMLKELVAYYGWEKMGAKVKINSFNFDPSITSSLRFLRKTDWARRKTEELYLEMTWQKEKEACKKTKKK